MVAQQSHLTTDKEDMKPEEKARENIDRLLIKAGWVIQDRKQMNLGESLGVAVREHPMSSGTPDYLLFINRRAVGSLKPNRRAQPSAVSLNKPEVPHRNSTTPSTLSKPFTFWL